VGVLSLERWTGPFFLFFFVCYFLPLGSLYLLAFEMRIFMIILYIHTCSILLYILHYLLMLANMRDKPDNRIGQLP
jgi:hypothetical protein